MCIEGMELLVDEGECFFEIGVVALAVGGEIVAVCGGEDGFFGFGFW